MSRKGAASATVLFAALAAAIGLHAQPQQTIGGEAAVPVHLRDGQEFSRPVRDLVEYGKQLFTANWTEDDGAGRPLSKGTGAPLSDATRPLRGARAFNRISGPDANSCYGCHNLPYAIVGGGGDVTTAAFEGADRFDFVTFDAKDTTPTAGAVDERGKRVSLDTVGSVRATPDLVGAGYVEMIARQMTRDLQRARDGLRPGQSVVLSTKGVGFGTLAKGADGRWNTGAVRGLSAASVEVSRGGMPSLVVRPWRSGGAASLREVTNASLNQHHGIQTTEQFGINTDPDGDGVANELTRADVTALTLFEATLPVPGRVIANDPDVERAVRNGEALFDRIRCTACHVAALALDDRGWVYEEPGPYNGRGNARPAAGRVVSVDLNDGMLPAPRLSSAANWPGVVLVPAYTDFQLHDISDAANRVANDPLNQRFLTSRLWSVGNTPPYFHHGLFTTIREAVLAHAGEALDQRSAFERLAANERDDVIEFLKSMQVLPPATKDRVVDEHFKPKAWPPR